MSEFQSRFPKYSKVRILVECALMIAVAYALSFIKIELPQGGSFTPASMLPILLAGLRFGPVWGISSGVVYGALQMLQSFYAPPTPTVFYFFLVVMLDYIIAFGVLGFSGFFPKNGKGTFLAVIICLFCRFICHFLSGILIWSSYAGDTPAALYSLIYNGSYMGVELVLTTLICFVLHKRGLLTRLLNYPSTASI